MSKKQCLKTVLSILLILFLTPLAMAISEWNANTVYQEGDRATWKNVTYEARWYSQNEPPDKNSGEWMVWKKVSDTPLPDPISPDPDKKGNYEFTDLGPSFYIPAKKYIPIGEIKIGEGRVGPVNGDYFDVAIPENRITWAIAIAHGYQLMRNIMRFNHYPPNTFLATALKESSLGYDHNAKWDKSLTKAPKPMFDNNDGFYQIEPWFASAYGEMCKVYPQRFTSDKYKDLVGTSHFETTTIAKVYYDVMVMHYWKYAKAFRPFELFDQSKDKSGCLKMVSAAFYMGHYDSNGFYKYIYETGRNSVYQKDYLTLFDENGFDSNEFVQSAKTHASKVTHIVDVLDNKSNSSDHFFRRYYDTQISWTILERYLKTIHALFPEIDYAAFKAGVQKEFNTINQGKSISFRYQLGKVIDKIVISLPVDNVVNGFKKNWIDIKWTPSIDYIPNL